MMNYLQMGSPTIDAQVSPKQTHGIEFKSPSPGGHEYENGTTSVTSSSVAETPDTRQKLILQLPRADETSMRY